MRNGINLFLSVFKTIDTTDDSKMARVKAHKKRNPGQGTKPKRINVYSSSFPNSLNLLAFLVVSIAICWKWIFSSTAIFTKMLPQRKLRSLNQHKIDEFLLWLRQNGAIISEKVTITEFEDYGGFGLMALGLEYEYKQKQTGPSIKKFDQLFAIPAKIIISVDTVHQQMEQIHPSLSQQFRQILNKHILDDFVQQDITIAMHLIAECSVGEESRFHPYLEILPQEIVPRLDTFSEDDYIVLNDPFLANIGRDSLNTLNKLWSDDILQNILQKYTSYRKRQDSLSGLGKDAECINFSTFHRFLTIVSSRAMILNNQKYLTPLSDMINYESSRTTKEEINDSDTEHHFQMFHQKNLDGWITVSADRDIALGQQIFEDYGNLDNSLYLEAFGFVPNKNPFHCANIPATYLPQPNELVTTDLTKVIVALGILPPYREAWASYVPNLCVQEDGNIDDLHAERYLTIATLSKHSNLLKKCVESLGSDSLEINCLHYLGKDILEKSLVKNLASRMYCDQKYSLEDDLSLLDSLLKESPSNQKILALKFRIEEARTLSQIGGLSYEECPHLNSYDN